MPYSFTSSVSSSCWNTQWPNTVTEPVLAMRGLGSDKGKWCRACQDRRKHKPLQDVVSSVRLISLSDTFGTNKVAHWVPSVNSGGPVWTRALDKISCKQTSHQRSDGAAAWTSVPPVLFSRCPTFWFLQKRRLAMPGIRALRGRWYIWTWSYMLPSAAVLHCGLWTVFQQLVRPGGRATHCTAARSL